MAGEYSEDPGSKSKGGLYTGVTQGYMVEEFNDWIFDETRKPGDYGLVKTSIGYHIMYFSGSAEIWYTQAKQALLSRCLLISLKMPWKCIPWKWTTRPSDWAM